MKFPQFTIRRLMIAVAIVAFSIAAIMAVIATVQSVLQNVDYGLARAYGKGGILDLQGQISTHLTNGKTALQQGRFAQAESDYRAVLKLNGLLHSKWEHTGGWTDSVVPTAELGVADALAGE